MMSSRSRPWSALYAVAVVAALALLGSCSSPKSRAESAPGQETLPGGGGTCMTPSAGCPCSSPGEAVDCGNVVDNTNGYVSCSMGSELAMGECGETAKAIRLR